MESSCLNCEEKINGNYCENCGQSTSIHRFSLKHFFVHDFVHGIFHVDKGFLYTIKELFTRPGHSIREFIQGKRAKHFNYFATVLLILTIDYFITKLLHLNDTYSEGLIGLSKFQKDFSKIVPFLGIPFYALLSWWIFRASKQNYTENLILNIYMVCGWLVINMLYKICFNYFPEHMLFVNSAFVIITSVYIYIFYYQYFLPSQPTKSLLIVRTFVITISILMIKSGVNYILNTVGMEYLH